MQTLGERLKYVREEILNLSQQELAEKLGLKSKVSVSDYERGAREPAVNILLTYCKLSGVSINWLLTGGGKIKLNHVKEPGQDYSATFTEQDKNLIRALINIPDARPLIYKFIIEKEKQSQLAHMLDELIAETISENKTGE